jgi:hypothetical protein
LTLTAGTSLSGVSSCADRPALAPAAFAAASNHFAAYARFERWALRSVDSDVRMDGEAALREMLFAPLRRDHAVAWAEVTSERNLALTYRTPLSDAALRFVPIDAPSLGRVQIATCETCKKQDGTARACVQIERPNEPTRRTHVRMAFCEPDSVPMSAPKTQQAVSTTAKTRAPKARASKQTEPRAQAAR